MAQFSDSELLRRFATDQDSLAFEVLIWRHGTMVLDVCGRVLGRSADAEDSFQATFLTLVRCANTVRSGESLAGWLYRVARRVSIRASRQRAQRSNRERFAARPEAVATDEVERSDWRAFLDHELDRLPACFREAFVLCHLEGRAHEDAARELGCPLGTLHSRLARAKERLRSRLEASGVALTAIVPGVATARLVTETMTAAIGLAEGSVAAASPAAVALSQGVWKPMLLIKAKFVVAAAIAVAVVGSGAGMVRQRVEPATATTTALSTSHTPEEPSLEQLKRENERLRREVASLKKQLTEAEARAAHLSTDDPPTDAEVLRALPKDTPGKVSVTRDDITITKVKILDRLDQPRDFPKVGVARLRRQHWECTAYFIETIEAAPGGEAVKKPRAVVVYIDKDALVPVKVGSK